MFEIGVHIYSGRFVSHHVGMCLGDKKIHTVMSSRSTCRSYKRNMFSDLKARIPSIHIQLLSKDL